ncbi:MAG: phage tail sheath C-terminal domain-containing protein, partial [Bacteroidota bacterium]
RAFFANGGGPCYIVSVGGYSDGSVISDAALTDGLAEVRKIDEVTLLVFPDSTNLDNSDNYYTLHETALTQCEDLQDRFTVMDVWTNPDPTTRPLDDVGTLRDALDGEKRLQYGAVYYPMLDTTIDFAFEPEDVDVVINGAGAVKLNTLQESNNAKYNQAIGAVRNMEMRLPAASAVVGAYARVDNARGVWKAPANVSIDLAIRPVEKVDNLLQNELNDDPVGGKSINAIRGFAGRGAAIIWGSRTLAGNDNEWRYVPVRRFFNMAEESIKKATEQFVFEPNDANTWVRVRGMIENFLTLQWRAGALAGATPEEAFFVRVGLGTTMTALDILEGRMIVEIGMAVVRPAEFIILRFSHKMQES